MKNNSITFRRATASDLSQIFQLQRLTWMDTYPNTEHNITLADIQSKFDNLNNEEKKEWNSRYLARINAVNTCFLLATSNDVVVGYCEAKKSISKHRIMGIYVLPNYQNMAIGSDLIRKALAWLGRTKTVYVNVVSYNLKAIAFYEKHGFSKTEKVSCDPAGVLKSGAILPEIEMKF